MAKVFPVATVGSTSHPLYSLLQLGIQIAGGVPLKCDETEGYQTFRLGLFGLDKLKNVDQAVAKLEAALDQIA